MRAMVTPQFGGADLFEERDVERPRPGAGEVLVRVVAAGTNPVDAKLRANGGSAGLEAPIIFGADISGVVEEVGPGVEDFAIGDEVYYTPEVFGLNSNGSYAEYHVAKADIVAKKPASLSHEEAAAVPLAGGTAYEAIVNSSQDVTEIALDDPGGKGVDAVFDSVGGGTIVESIPATKPFGRLATILGAQGDLTPLYANNQTLYGVFLTRERARLEEMSTLIERGQVRPLVAEVLPLEEVGKAHERLDSGHGRGEGVLRVAEE